MRSKALFLISALLICSLISNSSIFAQSKDRNNPTPLQSRVITGVIAPIGTVYWYKLTAGPGELVIEMQVVGEAAYFGTEAADAQFLLYDKDTKEFMNESISFPSQPPGAKPNRKNKSLKLQSKQEFLLVIKLGERMGPRNGPGAAYMIRFKGAIYLPLKESE